MNSVAYVDSLANNLRLSTEKMKVKNIYFSTRSRSEIYINTCRERLYQKKNQANSLATTVPRFKPNIDTCVIVKRKYLNLLKKKEELKAATQAVWSLITEKKLVKKYHKVSKKEL